MESGGCRRSPSSPSSSRNYTEPHRLAPRGIAIAWSGECFPPAIPDLIYESQDVVQNQRLRLEQEHCQNDNTTPYRHCISYVELAVNLIDILPWTTLPPVAQALIYIENLACYHKYIRKEEPSRLHHSMTHHDIEFYYTAISEILCNLFLHFGLTPNRS